MGTVMGGVKYDCFASVGDNLSPLHWPPYAVSRDREGILKSQTFLFYV